MKYLLARAFLTITLQGSITASHRDIPGVLYSGFIGDRPAIKILVPESYTLQGVYVQLGEKPAHKIVPKIENGCYHIAVGYLTIIELNPFLPEASVIHRLGRKKKNIPEITVQPATAHITEERWSDGCLGFMSSVTSQYHLEKTPK